MQEKYIRPEKITKPIQLLGAWLVGLFSIDSCFLLTAMNMDESSWAAGALIVAAIVNVPIFLIAVFLLQTKFRPELQEDHYFAQYLSYKTNKVIKLEKSEAQFVELRQRVAGLEIAASEAGTTAASGKTTLTLGNLLVGVNRHLPDSASIQSRLHEIKPMGVSTFGDSAPPHRIVAISQYLPRDTLREVVDLARTLGFGSYSVFDNKAERTDEDVLFGAYGEPGFQVN